MAISPDSQWLATGGSDGTVRIWDAAAGQARALMRVGNMIFACVWLGPGALAVGGPGGLRSENWMRQRCWRFRCYRHERYQQDRESWGARLRQSQGARQRPVSELDGWWSLDDPAGYNEMCRGPVILDDGVRAPRALIRAAEIA